MLNYQDWLIFFLPLSTSHLLTLVETRGSCPFGFKATAVSPVDVDSPGLCKTPVQDGCGVQEPIAQPLLTPCCSGALGWAATSKMKGSPCFQELVIDGTNPNPVLCPAGWETEERSCFQVLCGVLRMCRATLKEGPCPLGPVLFSFINPHVQEAFVCSDGCF